MGKSLLKKPVVELTQRDQLVELVLLRVPDMTVVSERCRHIRGARVERVAAGLIPFSPGRGNDLGGWLAEPFIGEMVKDGVDRMSRALVSRLHRGHPREVLQVRARKHPFLPPVHAVAAPPSLPRVVYR